MRWHDEWTKFTWGEALISAAVTYHNFQFEKALTGPRGPSVEFYVPLLDKEAKTLFYVDDPWKRRAYGHFSDLGYKGLVFTPYAVDVMLTLTVHRNPEVAAQLFLIDFEVFTLAAGTQTLISRLIGRTRPYVLDECAHGEVCGGGPYRSLLSGHTMAAFTAAGLMCVHHEYLPIFGGGAPDAWACAWAVSVASLTGVMRLPAGEHWASDILMGAGLGWIYGYYFPKLFHFHDRVEKAKTASSSPSGIRLMPSIGGTADGGLLSIGGVF